MSAKFTIDITPTWTAVLPIYLAALEDGTEKGRKMARKELYRMAAIADKAVEEAKAKPKETK